jgi:hypothetical protein
LTHSEVRSSKGNLNSFYDDKLLLRRRSRENNFSELQNFVQLEVRQTAQLFAGDND